MFRAVDDTAVIPANSIISCVSCRKRKLKCDRFKPKCSTCTRLRQECEYPESRRYFSTRKRNMKALEVRLAQVEIQLASAPKAPATTRTPSIRSTEFDRNNVIVDMNGGQGDDIMLDRSFDMPLSAFSSQAPAPPLPAGGIFSHELISLGLQEPLPPVEMVEELHRVYFDKFHPTMPMMHKNRYLAALSLPGHTQPPVCLRYAVWAIAASVSEKYVQYEQVLYERARRYVEAAEMMGRGETFATIQHAQTWGLIAIFEAKKAYHTRAWMSSGRMTRLVYMLGLQCLDGEEKNMKQKLQRPRDWIELEERRRTFWAAFYSDRWASSSTGWPMVINEKEIQTNLPTSEEAFERGIRQNTTSLAEALTAKGASKISSFGGVVLSACLYGHNVLHLRESGPDEHPEDLASGEFWKRHRQLDNVLSNIFMLLPDHLRLIGGLRDMNIVFVHMNIHASTICLHQAAVSTAERNSLDRTLIYQSQARSLMAAEEIANIMRLVSHRDASNMNSWMGFCLYVAAGVFIQDQRENGHRQSILNLEFIVAAMKAIGKRHSITERLTVQLELEIESRGIANQPKYMEKDGIPRTPMNGYVPERDGQPITFEDLRPYGTTYAKPDDAIPVDRVFPYMSSTAKGESIADVEFSLTPFFGILSAELRNSQTAHRTPVNTNWNLLSSGAVDQPPQPNPNLQQHAPVESRGSVSSSNPPLPPDENAGTSPFNFDPFLRGNTLSYDPCISNTVQYAYQ